MNKKRIIVLAGLGVVSFALTMGVGWMWRLMAGEQAPPPPAEVGAHEAQLAALDNGALGELRPKEELLDDLIAQMKKQRAEYDRKLLTLEERERRIKMSEANLTKQAEELEKLRLETIPRLRKLVEAKERLEADRVDFGQEEWENITKIAQIYEKMDPAEAAKTIENMCTNGQQEDAGKILYMMGSKAGRVLENISDQNISRQLTLILARLRKQG